MGMMKVKRRKCKNRECRQYFEPRTPWQVVCGNIECAEAVAIAQRIKRQNAEAREIRRKDKQRKEDIKTIPQLKQEAQIAFNSYIRYRDRDKPCISCGSTKFSTHLRGGKRDAGHYRSTGSADHLRYHEDNCHAQCKFCNRNGAGRAVDYRINLLDRIGKKRVKLLENSNDVIKWTREMLIEIRDKYRKKLKDAQCGNE